MRANDRRIAIAAGERIMFLQNDYMMLVKNGTLATVERIEAPADRKAGGGVLYVRRDDGRRLAIDTAQYGHFDHGYALTRSTRVRGDGRPRVCAGH